MQNLNRIGVLKMCQMMGQSRVARKNIFYFNKSKKALRNRISKISLRKPVENTQKNMHAKFESNLSIRNVLNDGANSCWKKKHFLF